MVDDRIRTFQDAVLDYSVTEHTFNRKDDWFEGIGCTGCITTIASNDATYTVLPQEARPIRFGYQQFSSGVGHALPAEMSLQEWLQLLGTSWANLLLLGQARIGKSTWF